ncbi:MAG: hypothetical protein DRQ51_06970, partial [Gammaproteobacteria bacterium]
MPQIFQTRVLNDFVQKQNQELIATRYEQFKKYQNNQDKIKTFIESDYQVDFLRDIFENCLGYVSKIKAKNNDFTLDREEQNVNDSKKADGALFVDKKVVAVIELKDTKTTDLERSGSNKISPVEQAFGYLSGQPDAKYVIVSNFDELRFYFDKKHEYEKFNLFEMDKADFYKLHTILSYESLKQNIPQQIKLQSAHFEENISKKFYNDYVKFRTTLYDNIIKNNLTTNNQETPIIVKNEVTKQSPAYPVIASEPASVAISCRNHQLELLNLTQKLIDRIVFILFAEDTNLLPTNTIPKIIKNHGSQVTDLSLFEFYKIYFKAINEGNQKLNINQYNGGLFAEDETLNNLIIDDEVLNQQADKLSAYNFGSDISVNILGHIFEQSISDIEKIQQELTRGHTTELTRGHTTELTRGHTTELTRGHTTELTRGHTT